ncbi:UNVERIFIED_CONTAM: hypothetical protein FKN15_040174 [Acipenser sinensis]
MGNNTTRRAELFNSTVLPAMLYGAETWSLTVADRLKLAVTEQAIERRMVGIKRTDRISNEQMRQMTKVKDAVELAKKSKKRWAGHLARRTDGRWTLAVTEWLPLDIKRPLGCPATRQRDQLRQEMGRNWMCLARDRKAWVTYRAQQTMTKHAITKMVAVWVLAFLLYGPAIIFWEFIVGKSNVPWEECYAEFYYTWYFLLSASTFEFFAPFISVTFFNLSIYMNIRKRNKNKLQSVKEGNGHLRSRQDEEQLGSVFFVKTSKTSLSEPVTDAVVTEEEDTTPSTSCPSNTFAFKKKRGSCTLKCINVDASISDGRFDTVSQKLTPHFRLSRDKKIAKSLAIIVCIFGICWAPYTLLMIIRAACSGRCVQNHWYEITFWLLWLNSAINPFLYPLCHSSFRRAFAKILCPKRQSIEPN